MFPLYYLLITIDNFGYIPVLACMLFMYPCLWLNYYIQKKKKKKKKQGISQIFWTLNCNTFSAACRPVRKKWLIQASQRERSVSSVLFRGPSGESSKQSPMHTSPWKSTDCVRRATLTSLVKALRWTTLANLRVLPWPWESTQMNRARHGWVSITLTYSLWLRTPTNPMQVLAESMECHSLYQEERQRNLPYWYSCTIWSSSWDLNL